MTLLRRIETAWEQLSRPIGAARGLPAAAYRDEDWHARELDALFRRGWVCVAAEAELRPEGALLPVEVAGSPVVLARGRDGVARAFHNVCAHRGAILVEAPCEGRVIRCPYHSWAYSLEGACVATPDIGGHGAASVAGIERTEFDLKPVRLEAWGPFLFVNLSGDAQPLADWLGPLSALWRDHDLGLLRHAGHVDFEIEANWKLAFENAVEFYHLPWVHPDLTGYSPVEVHYFAEAGDRFMGTATRDYTPVEVDGLRLPRFPGLPPARDRVGEYPVVPPSLMPGLMEDHAFGVVVTPLGPHRCRERLHLFVVGDEALGERFRPHRELLLQRWRQVNAEDIGIVESLHRGRASDAFEGGRFSPAQDPATLHFQRSALGPLRAG